MSEQYISNIVLENGESYTINANAITNQNTKQKLFFWSGPQSEYDRQNIKELHPDWICYITNDRTGNLTVELSNDLVAPVILDDVNVSTTKTYSSNKINSITGGLGQRVQAIEDAIAGLDSALDDIIAGGLSQDAQLHSEE